MRELRVLLPGIQKWMCGGLLVARKFAKLMNKLIPTRVFTYIDQEQEFPFVDLKRIPDDEGIIWLITWGPHINQLLDLLHNMKVIYYAQSIGWRISMQLGIPILCLSQFIMAKWMENAPYNPVYLMPPVLEPQCRNIGLDRDIDVLYLSRKSTEYLDKSLVPKLQKLCKVHIQREFITQSDLFQLYNRSKVYLYSSTHRPGGWVEGFGLQPLEATVCGCTVFSNLHGGLSDYLDPGICGHKLGTYSLDYDIKRILDAVHSHNGRNPKEKYLHEKYSLQSFYKRVEIIWPEIEEFLQLKEQNSQTLIPHLYSRSFRCRARRWLKNRVDRIYWLIEYRL